LRSPQKHKRFLKRVETEFTAGNKSFRGISSNLSIRGLFIRTNHPFVPDTLVDITIHLPGAPDVKLKGRVRHSAKTPLVQLKSGMGIEIIVNNPRYIDFIKTVFPDAQAEQDSEDLELDTSFYRDSDSPTPEDTGIPEFTIITCPRCGVKNKAGNVRPQRGLVCGKCRSPLTAD
jgi:hypothetical protein